MAESEENGQTVAPVETAPGAETAGPDDFAAMFAAQEMQSQQIQPGEKITGTIITIDGDYAIVDIGLKEDGIIDLADLRGTDGEMTAKPGDVITAFILSSSPQGVRLSRSMSGSGIGALEEAMAAQVPVRGKVTGACKGGFIVDVLGQRAFCPGSQLDPSPTGDNNDNIGRTTDFLITRLESRGRNIVVSRRALLDRERRENLDKLLATLSVGDTVEGKITRLSPFGAFVELAPGIEGLVHVSELGWSRVASPDELVSPGDMIRARVLSVEQTDKGQTRISLSRKQAEGDPWQELEGKLEPGAVVTGKVRRIAPFGAFVEILPGIEGLVHLSEMAWGKRVMNAGEIVAPGDEVSVKIKEINPEAKRISLSIKEAEGDPWQDVAERFKSGDNVSGKVESVGPHGIFVELAPGVTGLLGQAALKNAKGAADFKHLKKGDKIEVLIKSVDAGQRRVSLAPPEATETVEKQDVIWKEHPAVKPAADSRGFGQMAQAFQEALRKKK